jgi:hypothetical protein
MAPSVPRFTERLFISRIGSSGVSKTVASFFRSAAGTSAFCLGHNLKKICVSTRLVSSKISWIDIQFDSSKFCGHQRIIVRLQRCRRHPSMFKTTKETKTEKKHTSASIRILQLNKKGQSMVFTSSKSRHFIKAFSYSLLPLDTLLISISKGFLRFLCTSQC